MPYLKSSRKGDQLVKVIVEIPKKLSKNQKQLLKEFQMDGKEVIETEKGFFERMKEAF